MLAASDVEELSNFLMEKNLEKILLAYKVLSFDVQEIVTSNFDKFLHSETKHGFAYVTKETPGNVLKRLGQANIVTIDRRTQLSEFLNDSQVCRLLREFLVAKKSVENLLFIIDALDFEDLVLTFEEGE